MIIALVSFSLLALAGIAASIVTVVRDGYRPQPTR